MTDAELVAEYRKLGLTPPCEGVERERQQGPSLTLSDAPDSTADDTIGPES